MSRLSLFGLHGVIGEVWVRVSGTLEGDELPRARTEDGRFRQQTRELLETVGWRAGRAVNTARREAELAADGFPPLHTAALHFLAEFGGLVLPAGGAGVTRAREPIILVPTECRGEADRFIERGASVWAQPLVLGRSRSRLAAGS